MRNRRRLAALGTGTLVLLLVAGGIAIAGNGGGGKRTIRATGEPPTTAVEETTTSTEAPTTTTEATTTTSLSRPAVTTTTAPPAGLNITFEDHPIAGPIGIDVHFTVHVTDGNGMVSDLTLEYGDGTGDGFAVRASCIAGATNPTPVPTDKTYDYMHRYKSAGTFTATVNVTTGGGCDGIPTEHRTATVTFTSITTNLSQVPTTPTTVATAN